MVESMELEREKFVKDWKEKEMLRVVRGIGDVGKSCEVLALTLVSSQVS
jgi:hypothetical protein